MSVEQELEELKKDFNKLKEVAEQQEQEEKEDGEVRAETKNKEEKIQDALDKKEMKAKRKMVADSKEPKSELEAETKMATKAMFKAMAMGEGSLSGKEQKALSTLDNTQAGYLAPNEYVQELIKDIVEVSPVREAARVIETERKSVEIPRRTDESEALWVGEKQDNQEKTNSQYGLEEIPTHKLTAITAITQEMIEDAVFNMENEVNADLTEQFAKAEGKAFIQGDANRKPEGILTNSDVEAIDAEESTAGTLDDADDLIDLVYAPKTSYRQNGVFMINRNTIRDVRKLKDDDGQYLWQPGIAGLAPATILDQPYVEAPDMPDVETGATPVVYGDFERGYYIVNRIMMEMLRDPYSRKTEGIVEFMARMRVGGQVVLPEAIKKLEIQ